MIFLYSAAILGFGLLNHQIAERRHVHTARHLLLLKDENQVRREAEEQLEILIDSSPLAILTTNGEGVIVSANDTAHRLLRSTD